MCDTPETDGLLDKIHSQRSGAADDQLDEWQYAFQRMRDHARKMERDIRMLSKWQRMLSKWRPIESAPRDGTRILALMGDRVVIAAWSDEKYHARPKPHWKYRMLGVMWDRDNQPQEWMPLPEVPETKKL